MNFILTRVIILLSLKQFAECSLKFIEQNQSLMSNAVNEIAIRVFVGKFSNVRIISSTTVDVRIKTCDVVSDLILNLAAEMKITLEEPKTVEKSANKRNSPMIIIINSIASFEELGKKLSFDNMKFRKFFLLVLLDGIFPEVELILHRFWSFWIHNVGVLSEDPSGNIVLKTFFPYSNEKCGSELNLIKINEFNLMSRRWESQSFYPEKFSNLNLCPLKVALQPSNVPAVILKTSSLGIKSFIGVEVDLINEIMEVFNSTTKFEGIEGTGSMSTPGVLQSVYTRKNDVAIGTLSLQFDRTTYLTETKSFLSVPIVIVVPPGSKISSFQKLFRPFTVLIWILLVSVFSISIIVILVLKATSKDAYEFVIGKGIKAPILNLLIAFFGTTQSRLPNKNFARFLLMNFLIFCLVIRCLYQGKLFIMLQSDIREKKPATIDDIMDRNLIFFTYETLMKRVEGFKFASRFSDDFEFDGCNLNFFF